MDGRVEQKPLQEAFYYVGQTLFGWDPKWPEIATPKLGVDTHGLSVAEMEPLWEAASIVVRNQGFLTTDDIKKRTAQISEKLLPALRDGRIPSWGLVLRDTTLRHLPSGAEWGEPEALDRSWWLSGDGTFWRCSQTRRESGPGRWSHAHHVTVDSDALHRLFPDGKPVTPVEAVYRTGAPGRPGAKHLVVAELKRRIALGEIENTLREQAIVLLAWLQQTHPAAAPMTQRSIENSIRPDYNKAKSTASTARGGQAQNESFRA